MKLSRLIRERKKLVGEITRLEARAKQAAVVQIVTDSEGKDKRHEDYSESEYKEIMEQLSKKRAELFKMKIKISVANQIAEGDVCVQTLVIRRGELKQELSFYEAIRNVGFDRYERKQCRIPMREIDETVDKLVEEITDVESRINDLNARIEVGD